MSAITKKQFLTKFKSQFIGSDKKGYDHNGGFIPESKLSELSKYQITSLDEVNELITGGDDDDLLNFNNQIMAFLFGDGEDYQGSYEEIKGDGDYCWYLNIGNIEIDNKNNGIKYTGVRFYKDQ